MLNHEHLFTVDGDDMFDPELLERYRRMSPEEKMTNLGQILDMDVTPLDMVIAFYMILKPERADAMAVKLRAHD